jgi:hypothetical protein
VFIKLAVEGKLDQFYHEAEQALTALGSVRPSFIRDAVALNRSLLKLPFQSNDLEIECSTNVWEFYHSVLVGKPVPLREGSYRYRIDRTSEQWWTWEEWFQKVVWYGNKRGAYLYGNKPVEMDLAGHY